MLTTASSIIVKAQQYVMHTNHSSDSVLCQLPGVV